MSDLGSIGAFDDIKYIGSPVHGEYLGSPQTLEAPDGHVWSVYSAFPNAAWYNLQMGHTRVIKSTQAPGNQRVSPEEIAADAAAHYEYRDYALFSGFKNWYAGNILGQNKHIYVDGNGVAWILEYVFTADNTAKTLTLEIYNNGRFGCIGKNYSSIHKLIGTYTYQPSLPDWKSGATLSGRNMLYFTASVNSNNYNHAIEHNHQGDHCLFHVTTLDTYWGQYTAMYPFYLVDVLDIAISGNGDITESSTYGDDISAAISIYKTYSELHHTWDVEGSTFDPTIAVSFEYRIGNGICYEPIMGEFWCDVGNEQQIGENQGYYPVTGIDPPEGEMPPRSGVLIERQYRNNHKSIVRYSCDGNGNFVPFEQEFIYTIDQTITANAVGLDQLYWTEPWTSVCWWDGTYDWDNSTLNNQDLSIDVFYQVVQEFNLYVNGSLVRSSNLTGTFSDTKTDTVMLTPGLTNSTETVTLGSSDLTWTVNGVGVSSDPLPAMKAGLNFANSNNALAWVLCGETPNDIYYHYHDVYNVTPDGEITFIRQIKYTSINFSGYGYSGSATHTWQPITGQKRATAEGGTNYSRNLTYI